MKGKIFVIGFGRDEVEGLRATLDGFNVYEIPEYCRDWILQEIVEKADKLRGSGNWHVKKFLLMHNVSNNEVKDIISRVRSLNLGRVIFATTTPTSLTWKLDDLIKELIKEDDYFQQMQRARSAKFYLDLI